MLAAMNSQKLKRVMSVLACGALTLSLAACGERESDESRKGSQEILVAAAANLTEAFDELGARFEARSGVRVTFSYAATADLAKQIENGAPFDVFASADTERVDELERKQFVANGDRANFARGSLVLWTPPGARVRPAVALEDLARAEITRVAIAKPESAPYGRAAVEALRAKNLWQAVEPKVVYAQNVAQAKQFAATGNTDAALLPRALVKDGEGLVVEVDEGLHQPIVQALCVLKASSKGESARRFMEFVLSEEGQGVLEKYGYKKVPGAKQ